MAKTKVEGGPVSRVANAWNGLRGGTLTATTTKQNLTVGVGNPATGKYQCVEVIVQNSPDSSNSVFVGDARYQEFELIAGASLTVPINDLSLVYVRTTTGTATVNLLIAE
jgi:hypothetical protein